VLEIPPDIGLHYG